MGAVTLVGVTQGPSSEDGFPGTWGMCKWQRFRYSPQDHPRRMRHSDSGPREARDGPSSEDSLPRVTRFALPLAVSELRASCIIHFPLIALLCPCSGQLASRLVFSKLSNFIEKFFFRF
jgi:hypothetical protein